MAGIPQRVPVQLSDKVRLYVGATNQEFECTVQDIVSMATGSTPTLQQVTDQGATTSNDIELTSGNLILSNDSIIQLNNAAGAFFTAINNSEVTANRTSTLIDADGLVPLVTGSVNTNPSDTTVEVKIPFAVDANGTVYYILASTNNT